VFKNITVGLSKWQKYFFISLKTVCYKTGIDVALLSADTEEILILNWFKYGVRNEKN